MGPGLPPSLVLVVLLTGLARAQDILSNADTRPPTIFRVTHRNVYFSEKEKIELTCIADGNPKPVYHWLKDGDKLDITSPENSHRMHMKSNVGTLVISPASRSDEGIYQCVAQNNFGKSLSIKRNVYLARIAKFPTVVEPEMKRVLVGRSLKLECTPPESIPKAKISWIIVGSDAGDGDYPDENEDFNQVNLNRRITMDYDGNLYITQVIEEDAMGGARYVCMANNRIMRSFNQGEDKVVQPFGKARDQPVDLLWHSAPTVLGLQRRKVNFKCIFSGRPQADITWNRIGGKWDDARMVRSRDQFELTISNLQYDDQGEYECVGSDVVFNKDLKQTFSLMVEAKPTWEKQPQNVTVGVEESASVSCNPKGRPEPNVRWYINGNPIENEPPNPRRKLVGNTLHFSNVTRGDSQVIQCNASNTHGFIWADVFLHVLAIPAKVENPPLKTLKVAEGQDITVTCESTGKPMPKVIWFKGDQQLSGARYQIKPNGNLVITEVTDNDSGNYKCYASNRFGKDSANGTLLVREKTKIVSPPLDLKLDHGNDAVFKCGAITDPAEQLEYIWLRDGVRIEKDEDPRVDLMDGTLKIMDVNSGDTAEYTCMASNGLDNATAVSALEVKAPPDPPFNLSLVRCFSSEAEVSWVFDKELENFSPVQSFIVEYNTSFAPNKWTEGVRTAATSRSAKIALSLWVQYSFRVKAVNDIGVGKPSSITPSICKTPRGLPERHPRKVKTVGDKTNYLIIEWEPMDQIEHNGPGFFYNITVKGEDGVLMKLMETNHTVGRMEIKVDKIYAPYNITVGAQNVVGQPYIKPKIIRGYSGQATPKVVPGNFELDPDKNVTATTAYFRWDPVNTSKEAMQGVFIGYTIRFWKVGQEDTTMHEVFIPQTNGNNGANGPDKKVTAAVNNLPSYSEIEADVTARNTYFSSNSSNSIMFSTPEGVPSSVEYLEALFRGSTHFLLEWGEPEEPNGIITGYKIGYSKINGLQLDEPEVGDMVTRRRMFLGSLEPDTLYRVSVWAYTQEGQGEEYYIDVRTAEMASELTQPKIDAVMPSDNAVNVSWLVSDTEGVRVGSHYYLEYRELGKGEWTRVQEARNDTFWQQIEDLESGMTYQVRVVAADGEFGSNTYKKTPSEKRTFTTMGVVPSAVEYLEILFRGSSHFLLEWGEPLEPNGVIIGYKIGYAKTDGLEHGNLQMTDMITRRRMSLGNLEPDTLYRVSVWAFTQEGQGQEYYTDMRTAELASELAEPRIDLVIPTNTAVNVTWQVSDMEGVRIGSHFYLEYRALGDKEWTRVQDVRKDTFWQQIENLESGMTYQVRVVAADGVIGSNTYKKTPSEKRTFTTTDGDTSVPVTRDVIKVVLQNSEPLDLICETERNHSMKVEWQKEGEGEVVRSMTTLLLTHHGARDSRLVILKPKKSDEGMYICKLSGPQISDSRYYQVTIKQQTTQEPCPVKGSGADTLRFTFTWILILLGVCLS